MRRAKNKNSVKIPDQEQADIAYYTSLTDKDKAANAAWTKITTEAAKHIWKNEMWHIHHAVRRAMGETLGQ